jgi:hypothetical protein
MIAEAMQLNTMSPATHPGAGPDATKLGPTSQARQLGKVAQATQHDILPPVMKPDTMPQATKLGRASQARQFHTTSQAMELDLVSKATKLGTMKQPTKFDAKSQAIGFQTMSSLPQFELSAHTDKERAASEIITGLRSVTRKAASQAILAQVKNEKQRLKSGTIVHSTIFVLKLQGCPTTHRKLHFYPSKIS